MAKSFRLLLPRPCGPSSSKVTILPPYLLPMGFLRADNFRAATTSCYGRLPAPLRRDMSILAFDIMNKPHIKYALLRDV